MVYFEKSIILRKSPALPGLYNIIQILLPVAMPPGQLTSRSFSLPPAPPTPFLCHGRPIEDPKPLWLTNRESSYFCNSCGQISPFVNNFPFFNAKWRATPEKLKTSAGTLPGRAFYITTAALHLTSCWFRNGCMCVRKRDELASDVERQRKTFNRANMS